ncbi:MAG: hypothetical protein Q9160_002922 [Pyrenula sp. 1 TL-2023]
MLIALDQRWGFLLSLISSLFLPLVLSFPSIGDTLIISGLFRWTSRLSNQSPEPEPQADWSPWMLPAPIAEASLAQLSARDIEDLYNISQPFDLTKRALDDVDPTSQNAIQCHLDRTLPKAAVTELCPSPTWPTSVQRRLGRSYFGIGTKGGYLEGCTVLCAIKDDTVYLAHYWEVPGFSAGGDFRTALFQQTVISYLNSGKSTAEGAPTRADPALNQLSDLKGGAVVYILTIGARGGTNVENYPARIRDIQASINADSALGGQTTFHVQPYARPGNGNPNVRVLFEYDPGEGNKLGANAPRVRLMYSNHVLFDLRRSATAASGWS